MSYIFILGDALSTIEECKVLNITEIQINSRKLIPILEKVFGKPILELKDWKVEPLGGGLEQSHQLFRFSGEAVLSVEGQTQAKNASRLFHPWSLVLKIIHPAPTAENDPQGLRYWKREALAYQSGLLEKLSCGLIAPQCYEASQEGDEYWLWLEEVQDDLGKPWSIQQHYEVARSLGCFNGAYLTGTPLPDKPWLSTRWLRRYVEGAAPMVQSLPDLRKLPLFQRTFPHLKDDFIIESWKKRGVFLDAIECLPQTYCHQDAFAGNLFWRGKAGEKGVVTALDWAYTGIAAVGEELAPLIVMSSFMLDTGKLLEACFEGYLAGLKESGWDGDQVQVRFGVLATSYYRYLFGAGFGEMWVALRDESNHAAIAAAFGVPDVGILCDQFGALNQAFQSYWTEASQILAQLG